LRRCQTSCCAFCPRGPGNNHDTQDLHKVHHYRDPGDPRDPQKVHDYQVPIDYPDPPLGYQQFLGYQQPLVYPDRIEYQKAG
jgi:hypothetical protein